MAELKPLFLDVAKVAIIEYIINHPGKRLGITSIYESMHKLTEEQIQRAYEKHNGNLTEAILEYIYYEFTGHKSKTFKEPSWIPDPKDK